MVLHTTRTCSDYLFICQSSPSEESWADAWIESLSRELSKGLSSSIRQDRASDLVVVTAESGLKLEQASAWHVSPSNFKQPRRLPTYFQPDHTLCLPVDRTFTSDERLSQLETVLGLFKKAFIPRLFHAIVPCSGMSTSWICGDLQWTAKKR